MISKWRDAASPLSAGLLLAMFSAVGWGQGIAMRGPLEMRDPLAIQSPPELEPLPDTAIREARRQSFTLSDLEGLALRNNPALAAAASGVEAARGRTRQAGLYPNPIIGYHAMQMGNLGTAGQQGAFVTQRVITGGKRLLDVAQAGWGESEALARYDIQRRRVVTDVRTRFYDALIAQRRVEMTRELVKISQDLATATQRLLADRQSSESVLLQAEIEAEQAAIQQDNALEQDLASWRRLTATLGIRTLQPSFLEGDPAENLPRLDWDASYQAILASSPQLAAAAARRERARVTLLRAQREVIPNIDATASVRHDNITGDNVTNLQVGVPIPIFDRNQGAIQRAEAEWTAAQLDIRRLELQLQDRLATAFRRYAAAVRQTDRYAAQILPRASRSLELISVGYEKGQTDFLSLLTAQRTYIQTNLSYLDSLQEVRRASVLIEGQLLEGGLSEQP